MIQVIDFLSQILILMCSLMSVQMRAASVAFTTIALVTLPCFIVLSLVVLNERQILYMVSLLMSIEMRTASITLPAENTNGVSSFALSSLVLLLQDVLLEEPSLRSAFFDVYKGVSYSCRLSRTHI